jgi:exonuclease SbcD
MKILHTSDWHLGRRLHGYNMHDAQREFIAHLEDVIQQKKVEVLLISGDIFDRGFNPQLDAQALLDEALLGLSAKVQIVAISGNHDQPLRLNYGSGFMKRAGVHLITDLNQVLDPIVIGEGSEQTAFYGIPYLEPIGIAERMNKAGMKVGDREIEASDNGVITAITDQIFEHQEKSGYKNTVVLSHAWFTGGVKAGSELDTVGGLHPAAIETVSRFTYAALGHLHSPITLTNNVRYSGSPVYYSFAERKAKKSSWLVEVKDGKATVEEILVPTYRALTEISGTVAECISGKYADHKDDFIKVKLTELEANAGDKLQTYFPYFLTLEPPRIQSAAVDWDKIDSQDPLDVCCAALEFNLGRELKENEKQLVIEAIEFARVDALGGDEE